uniref:Translation initiation factor IF-2, chloroplastic n=1 Tax=Digenea simplex TaxID=945030 RepID=A0A1Z1MTW8_DIGSM|nr:translation initiation factor 2 [Digenea simplex]ARW69538.1 translation initiation factor 2 [Digenea simplex]
MIKFLTNNYFVMLPKFQSLCNNVSLFSSEYSDSILELTLPKLVYSTDPKSIVSKPFIDVNTSVDNILSSKSNTFNRFEKKHKQNTYSQDIIEAKKNKNKVIKKKLTNSPNIDKDDIFIHHENNILSSESSEFSLLKPHKSIIKHKKKEKMKSISFNNNVLEVSIDSHLDNSDNIINKKNVTIDCPLTVKELSVKLYIPEAEVIRYLFLEKSISATINQVLGISIAKDVALHYGYDLIDRDLDNYEKDKTSDQIFDSSNTIKRSPIITILGHVDHGKTSLLDAILKTNVKQKELGGITQTITGYEIRWICNSKSYELIFLDTPGHESFKSMRLRGAKVTDIALLVIAVDDGLKPQTIESIKYIREMQLDCIVVLTKIDKLNTSTNINQIKQDLANYDLLTKEWGGQTPVVEVSALESYNIDLLLSNICHLSDIKSFTADPNQLASGIILESYLDKKQGPVANIVIQDGTLKLGDIIISSNMYGKIKSITNLSKCKLKISGPSSIVQILGFSAVPQAGFLFQVVKSEKEAKQICSHYFNKTEMVPVLKSLNPRITLGVNSNMKQLKLIIKAETQGSLEAIIDVLSSIPQSKVQLNIVSANLGNLSNNDVEIATTTNSIITCFNINPSPQAMMLMKKNSITYNVFNIIYDLLNYVRNSMLNLIEPEYDKIFIGCATVQTIFKISKGIVAGCLVNEGKIKKMSYIHVKRADREICQCFLTSLKRGKNDVDEVYVGSECGLMANYDLWEENDTIDVYDLVAKEKTLG